MPSVETRFRPEEHVPLAPLATLGVGGSARWLFRARTPSDVAAAHDWSAARDVALFVMGGGSNVVVADGGFDGLVLLIALAGTAFTQADEHTLVRAGAGESWDTVVEEATRRGLAGVECLSGIPGSVGGTPVQNVGAYGQEVADSIASVTVFDRETGTFRTLTNAECGFAYRTSRFKGSDRGRFVVCDVTFRLRAGRPTVTYPDVVAHFRRQGVDAPTLSDVRAAVLAIRRGKGMVIDATDPDTRSVGSFFLNPVVPAGEHQRLIDASPRLRVPGFTLPGGDVKIPAAWLIERAGVGRGFTDGPAGLSTKHPLAIVNRGGATARDIVRLAVRIKRLVAERCGVWLRPEPVFVGFDGDPDVEYLQRAHD